MLSINFKISGNKNIKWGKVDNNMKTHENDPFFIKKAEKALAIIKEFGLPSLGEKH